MPMKTIRAVLLLQEVERITSETPEEIHFLGKSYQLMNKY